MGGSGAGGGLEPTDDAAPGGGLSGGHGSLQPENHFAAGDGDACGAAIFETWRGGWCGLRGCEPIGAGVSQRPSGRGGGAAIGRGAGDGQFEQSANLFLEGAQGL